MKDRTILLIAAIVLVVYTASRYYFSVRKDSAFYAQLMQIDTAKVITIALTPPNEIADITIKREGDFWFASNGLLQIRIPPATLDTLLGSLLAVQAIAIATQKAAQWSLYDVQEGAGTQVRLFDNGGLIEDFIIGRSATLPNDTAITYLRFAKASEVYMVVGDLAQRWRIHFDDLRNKLITRLTEDIAMLHWQTPDSIWQIQKTGQGWACGPIRLDSAAMTKYLSELRQVDGEVFADDFNEVKSEQLLFEKIILFSVSGKNPIEIACYRDTLRPLPFIIRSSQNTEAFFASDSTGVYGKTFLPLRRLLFSHSLQ